VSLNSRSLPNWYRAAVLPSMSVQTLGSSPTPSPTSPIAFWPSNLIPTTPSSRVGYRAEVHEVALSDASGRGTLYVPLSDQGVLLHLAGSLKRSHFQFRNIKTYDVEIRTLDEVGLAGVRFVKADVEGGEREVLDGARATIARDRPIILLELLSGTHDNPAAETAAICETFGYEAFIVQRGEKIAALPAITALGKNTSWGTDIESRNVLFLPR
jgi:FkbM family methyltransferase